MNEISYYDKFPLMISKFVSHDYINYGCHPLVSLLSKLLGRLPNYQERNINKLKQQP